MNLIYRTVVIFLPIFWSISAVAEPDPSDKAQVSGRQLEVQIEVNLRNLGLEIIQSKNWNEARLYREPSLTAVVKNVRYKSIYGHRPRVEFLLLDEGRRFLIEVKRQRVAGSVDEKLPYVYENALLNLKSGYDFILVIEGEGWKPGAIKWIKNKAELTEGFNVMSPTGFLNWVRANIL